MGDTEVLTSALIPESLHAQIIAELEKQRTARAMHRQFIGEDTPEDDYDEVLLPSLADAQAIFSVLEAPHDYEIVRLSREPFTDQNTLLGYDVGYWGGDHFSLICDTVIQPLAHPPDPGEFAALGEHLRCLNEVMLFQSAADARTFRDFYLSTSWGETENPWAQFSIIQLSLPNLCNGPW